MGIELIIYAVALIAAVFLFVKLFKAFVKFTTVILAAVLVITAGLYAYTAGQRTTPTAFITAKLSEINGDMREKIQSTVAEVVKEKAKELINSTNITIQTSVKG